MIKNDDLRALSENLFCRKFPRFWGKNLDWNFHPCKKFDIFHVCLLPGSRWTPFLPRESVVSALEKPPTNRHKIDQETIRIKIQIEMLQNQVTINIANCNTAVICINVIIKRVL